MNTTPQNSALLAVYEGRTGAYARLGGLMTHTDRMYCILSPDGIPIAVTFAHSEYGALWRWSRLNMDGELNADTITAELKARGFTRAHPRLEFDQGEDDAQS